MLGMIAFGGKFENVSAKLHSKKSFLFTVLYRNVGWGNFEGYEKLESVLR